MKAMKMRQQNYYALSVVYLNLDAEELTRFLSLFIDKTKDVDTPWYTELFGPSVGQVNEDYSEWNVMLQRITVLQEVGVFRAYIYADSPDIKIEEDEESKALTINFKEYRNIGSESAPTFSNLGDSSIKVKYTMEKAGKTGVSKTIGYIPIVGDVASFVIDTATDYKENKR